jgi:branched-chain amino acid transport system substrate-binding protein
MTVQSHRLLAAILALVVAAAVASCGGSSPSGQTTTTVAASRATRLAPHTLTIYSSMQLQGAQTATDESIADAELLALEAQHGEVAGYRIRLVVMDNAIGSTGAWNAATVRQNAEEAAGDPSAIAYLGDDTSGATAISIPIINRAGILQVSPTATATALTLGGTGSESLASLYPTGTRTFARVIPSDAAQALAQAQYQDQEQCQRVVVIDDGSVYGAGLASGVVKADATLGVTVVGRATVAPTQRNFAAVDARVLKLNANCVFFGGNTTTYTAKLWNSLGGASATLKLFGPDALATSQFAANLTASVGARAYLTSPGLGPNAYSDIGQEYYEAYEDRFGGFPDPEAIFGYEAMSAVLAAIKSAGAGHVSRAAVVREFFKIENRQSVIGTYSIDANGDTTLDAYGANVVQGGALVFDHTLAPLT